MSRSGFDLWRTEDGLRFERHGAGGTTAKRALTGNACFTYTDSVSIYASAKKRFQNILIYDTNFAETGIAATGTILAVFKAAAARSRADAPRSVQALFGYSLQPHRIGAAVKTWRIEYDA